MHSRRATGAGMQSGASAPKTRRLTANTRQNNTHRGTGKCEASSWRGKPGIPAPGGGQGSGWTRLCASYSPSAHRTLPPLLGTVRCNCGFINIATGYYNSKLNRLRSTCEAMPYHRKGFTRARINTLERIAFGPRRRIGRYLYFHILERLRTPQWYPPGRRAFDLSCHDLP